jgi:hypothetical protein
LSSLKLNLKGFPSRHHWRNPSSGKTVSKIGLCPQLQVGETGTKEYSMTAPKQTTGTLCIAHCLELSLDETPKNENLLIAACHFWSNGANAFLFVMGQCPPPWPMYI